MQDFPARRGERKDVHYRATLKFALYQELAELVTSVLFPDSLHTSGSKVPNINADPSRSASLAARKALKNMKDQVQYQAQT